MREGREGITDFYLLTLRSSDAIPQTLKFSSSNLRKMRILPLLHNKDLYLTNSEGRNLLLNNTLQDKLFPSNTEQSVITDSLLDTNLKSLGNERQRRLIPTHS